MNHNPPHVIGFAAFSGTGKTSLLKRLIPLLSANGLRLGVIKLSHHDFSIDQPGKDSYELHKAGAAQTLLTSRYRSALVTENLHQQEPDLFREIEKLDLHNIDLVLVEGFRHQPQLAKIELHRNALSQPMLHTDDKKVLAVAADQPLDTPLPLLDLNDPGQICDWIIGIRQRGLLRFPLQSEPVHPLYR